MASEIEQINECLKIEHSPITATKITMTMMNLQQGLPVVKWFAVLMQNFPHMYVGNLQSEQ